MKRFPRGSEWRKWDLHIHLPDTKLSNGYDKKDHEVDWDSFCKIIYESDVYAFGLTDYFTIDGFFTFMTRYKSLYPESEKVFFPNLELRLNESVNGTGEMVDFHIIFRPDLTQDDAIKFLLSLRTEKIGPKGQKISCADLKTESDYSTATVSRSSIENALMQTFGDKSSWDENVILIAAANNDGIRADTKSKRKMSLADQIDRFANAFFGNSSNTDYFLQKNRYEDSEQKSRPKPVFSGCDAHNFPDLKAWLGKEVINKDNQKYVTWIKADLTYEGLQQTLIEPSERVKIQSTMPDEKEPYRVISKIAFNDPDFPKEIVFNSGLNTIIGSRSSGKSSLLAYIAHAVDPKYTVQQQIKATDMKEGEAGPAASITWNDVKSLKYNVEWAAPEATHGRVIYIPQNSLFAISERPEDVTAKIRPSVFNSDPSFEAQYNKALSDVKTKNGTISASVAKWFSLSNEINALETEVQSLGDSKAIAQRKDDLSEKIDILRKSTSLTEEEIELYKKITETIEKNEKQIKDIDQERQALSLYIIPGSEPNKYSASKQIESDIINIINPLHSRLSNLPCDLQIELQAIIKATQDSLIEKISSAVTTYRSKLDDKYNKLTGSNESIRKTNEELINKNLANSQISLLLKSLNSQTNALSEIEKKSNEIKAKKDLQTNLLAKIKEDISLRDEILETLKNNFNRANHTLENMSFSIELGFTPELVEKISTGFNKIATSPYIKSGILDLNTVFTHSTDFVNYMASGKQKLNHGEDAKLLTGKVLSTAKDVRFVANMEGDRIGGFKKSSMTAGKQALFALTLILSDQDEPWPLLIDQPEDDLDSRSICDVIVNDLIKRKRQRQIIMVTHNANLAIGADSEEIIVANRNGDDLPNENGQMFAYLTGSLEYSKPKNNSIKFILASAGIREHACKILDGGIDAFQKRKSKYRI